MSPSCACIYLLVYRCVQQAIYKFYFRRGFSFVCSCRHCKRRFRQLKKMQNNNQLLLLIRSLWDATDAQTIALYNVSQLDKKRISPYERRCISIMNQIDCTWRHTSVTESSFSTLDDEHEKEFIYWVMGFRRLEWKQNWYFFDSFSILFPLV